MAAGSSGSDGSATALRGAGSGTISLPLEVGVVASSTPKFDWPALIVIV